MLRFESPLCSCLPVMIGDAQMRSEVHALLQGLPFRVLFFVPAFSLSTTTMQHWLPHSYPHMHCPSTSISAAVVMSRTLRRDAALGACTQVLREDGGFEYKKAIVESILILIREIPDAKESGLAHLCEFIEVRLA